MIRNLQSLLADLTRITAIVWIAVTYNAAPLLRLLLHLPARDPYPVRIRLTLERLGTTYLKLGQFMAMRFDLLPRLLCDELQKLFEQVPPIPYATICAVIERELGASPAELFAELDPRPIGSASIAQVHRATSRGGAQLAIKIQRPGIAAKLEADMRALRRLAAVIDRLGLLPGVPLQEMAAEFAAFTRRELDFVREGSTALRLRNQRTPNETVPRIHWPLTTSRILAMDFIPGLSIAQAAQLQAAGRHDAIATQLPGFSLDTTLHNFATASLHQLFGTGFFHADPHPGNILLMADNRIAFIDFGIFGSISRDKRDLLMTYAESAAIGDIDSAWRAFARLAAPTDRTDMRAYRRATMAHLTRWYRNSLEPGEAQPHIGELVGQMTDIMRRHHVRIDLETLLFWRAVIALDSSALTLCPQFDLAGEMRLYFAATQMQPAQRVLKAMTDRRRIASIVQLADMMPRATSSLTALATMERHLDIAEQMPVAKRRAEHRMAQLAICAMLVIAVSIASTP